jgi:hypothetical protein
MSMRISRAAMAAAAIALGVSGASADPLDSKDLVVQVEVASSCNITSIPAIAFTGIGAGALTTEEIKTSAVQVSCNNGGWNLKPASEPVSGYWSMTSGFASSLNFKLCTSNPASYAACNLLSASNPISGVAATSTNTIYAIMEGGKTPVAPGHHQSNVTLQLTN